MVKKEQYTIRLKPISRCCTFINISAVKCGSLLLAREITFQYRDIEISFYKKITSSHLTRIFQSFLIAGNWGKGGQLLTIRSEHIEGRVFFRFAFSCDRKYSSLLMLFSLSDWLSYLISLGEY